MSTKRRLVERDVQRFDKTLRKSSYSIYCKMMEVFVQAYPSEVRNKVLGLLRARDFEALLSWADSFGSAMQATAAEAYAASQLVALIKKYPFPAPSLKPKARDRALVKFLQAEQRCKRYNLKFSRVYSPRLARQEDMLSQLSFKIRSIIGEKPNLDLIYDACGFGPGASVGVHGTSTNLARKLLSEEWTCTPSALPFAVAALSRDQHIWELLSVTPIVCWDISQFRESVTDRIRLVHYNKIVTVPKTTLVDRTIAVEPLLNGYLQKGTDVYMRRLLKRIGIDLTDQCRNQMLAKLGSFEQSDPFVTIDLSMASDSISKAMVRRLVPPDWYSFLDAIRSPAYLLPNADKAVRYEKFVSMGNGFCFPLETLIFASVCLLFSKPADISVYGDDIIVRQSVAKKVVKTLWALGFRHNPEKTFLQGQFRESCGADWFAGRDIRPLTLDYELDSLSSLIKFHNLSKQKDLWSLYFREVREYLLGLVPWNLQLTRPYSGNVFGAFEVELDKFQSSAFSSWDRDIQCWRWWEIEMRGVPDKGALHHDRSSTLLMMAAVRGSLSSMPFAKRRTTSQSIRRVAYAGASSTWLPPQYR